MELWETFAKVRNGIVALGSNWAIGVDGQPPFFPTILGTGFVVDERGIVVTNRHVVEKLQTVPPNPANGRPSTFAMVSGEAKAENGEHVLPLHFVDVIGYSIPETFECKGDYFGEPMPDLAFLQINVKGLSALTLGTEPNTLRIGRPIATAGYALGAEALVLYEKVVQITPLLRHGVVSSLFPGPVPSPHGFTIDVMVQGGASGSPVFLTDSPTVVGLLYSGRVFRLSTGEKIDTNITMALPSSMVSSALSQCLEAAGDLDLSNVPTFQSLGGKARDAVPDWQMFRAED